MTKAWTEEDEKNKWNWDTYIDIITDEERKKKSEKRYKQGRKNAKST